MFSLGHRVVREVSDLTDRTSQEGLTKEAETRSDRIRASRKKGEK